MRVLDDGQFRAERPLRDDAGVLHEVFEARADERPLAIALAAGRRTRSYGHLERHANRLARHLWARGVRRGSRVGLLLRRSVDAYAGMLGILKVGAACVPLDPGHAPARTAYLLDDSDATALLTTAEFARRHAGFRGAIVRVDADREAIAAESPARLRPGAVNAGPGDLCYVLYTADALGNPKGVMIEHRSVRHLAQVEGQTLGVRPWDRVYHAWPPSGDTSVPAIWLAFQAGATLVAPVAERAGRPLARHLSRARVTVLRCSPSFLVALRGDVRSVRLLILGGETCPDWLVHKWTRADRRLVNTYGRTETSAVATHADLLPGRRVTVGRPLPGCRVYVLDAERRFARFGSIGEICVGGVGVARGYVGLPAETESRFIPDPFAPGAAGDARLYLTGDLGRIDASGNLELHGRAGTRVAWPRDVSLS